MRAALAAVESRSPDLAAVAVEHLMFRTTRHPMPDRERAVLATGRPFAIHSRHGRVAAWRWGEGPVVILTHGWNGRGSQLGALVDPLVTRGFQVVAFDAPGHGASRGTSSSLPAFADALDAVIDAVRSPFEPVHAVVAHSMGGAATTYGMSRFRRTPETHVERALREAELPVRRFVFVAPPVDVRDFVRSAGKMLHVGTTTQEAVTRRVEARFGLRIEELYAPAAARDLHAPLLVIHDEDDREVPIACGQLLASAWPGARIHRTRGLGHMRILRDPSVVQEIVGFVSEPA
ncbi:Hydrolase [Minicystis rosea]|nr:Hydrolase [Minicystis rosea]